jgi:alcohol dehydrogenase class IV
VISPETASGGGEFLTLLPAGVLRGPRTVVFGVGQRRVVPALVRASGGEALVVTDPWLADSPHLGDLVNGLRAAGVATQVFDEAAPELPLEQVPHAVHVARRGGAEVVVAFGGGSCVDLAKVVALVLAHGGSVPDYYGENAVPGPTTPVIAIPTTAGTGSEVTPVAVITDPDRVSKVGISSPHLIPAAAVCDPELTVSCPPSVSAAAGADALSHGVEAFTAIRRPVTATLATERVFVGKGVLTDVFALLAVSQVAVYLRRVCQVSDDLQARSGMMLAALAGGYAFGTAGTAAAHALQYPIGALTHTSHGVGVGTLLPYVMAFNAATRIPELAELATALGVGECDGAEEDSAGRQASGARAAVTAVADLLASVGIPANLAVLGAPADRLPWAAAEAMTARRLVDNNPRPLDEAAALALLRAAYAGDRTAAAAIPETADTGMSTS